MILFSLFDMSEHIALQQAERQPDEEPMMRIFSQQNCSAELANRIWSAKAEQVVRGTNTIITDV